MLQSLTFTGSAHQSQQVIVTTILCNVLDVLLQRLGLIGRQPLQDSPEHSTLTDTATDIAGEEQGLHCQVCVLSIGTEEAIGDFLITFSAQGTDRCEQIQTFRLGGSICSCAVLGIGHIRFFLQKLKHVKSLLRDRIRKYKAPLGI